MILPEIFILLGICMLLLMSLSERSQNDQAKKPVKSIFKAQITAVNTWFENGVSHKAENTTYSQGFLGSQRTRRRHKLHKENLPVMSIPSE